MINLSTSRRLIVLAACIGIACVAQRASAQETKSVSSDTAVKVDDGFDLFLARFRKAVAANDKQAVAAMTDFPFVSYDFGWMIGKPKHDPQFTRVEFLKYYNKLFTKQAKYLIAVSTPTPLTDDDGVVNRYAIGIRSTKNTAIWIQFWRDDNGAWWLGSTDNVSMGDDEDGD
jgi:hypothetical protein